VHFSSSKGLTRRNVLSLGGAGILSALFSQLSSNEAAADDSSPNPAAGDPAAGPVARARSCIMLWMNGGPSHLDTFDPKPGSKVAGPFKAIATRSSGVSICEHLPGVAEKMNRIALLRGVSSKEGNHQRAQEMGHTGHVPNPTVQAPSIGAWVLKKRPASGLEIPSFVSLGGPSAGGGFFGNPFDPFVVQRPGERPDDLAPARAVGPGREQARRAFLAALESDFASSTRDAKVGARTALYARARTMMGSRSVEAFDVMQETESLRTKYGDNEFGRGCLVARRLVEIGVPFVEVTLDGWDTHKDNFERTKGRMGILDPALASLLGDLEERALLDSTMVVCMGEFGRSPRINGNEGRDHHPGAFSVAMAGGGVRGGIVHGQTDAEGASVVNDGVSVPDVIATIAQLMGVDPRSEAITPAGRPIQVTQQGKPIAAVIGS